MGIWLDDDGVAFRSEDEVIADAAARLRIDEDRARSIKCVWDDGDLDFRSPGTEGLGRYYRRIEEALPLLP